MLTGAARKDYERSSRARKHEVRPFVIRNKNGKRLLRVLPSPPHDPDRPQSRSECVGGIRPCPYISCRHHLYLDVNPRTGSIKLNRPELEPHELQDSCSLDVADEGGTTMESVAALLNLTRERVRQIEDNAMRKVMPLLEAFDPNEDE